MSKADVLEQVQSGDIFGITGLVNKFGRNAAVPNGSWAGVAGIATLVWPTAAAAVRVKAGGNAADDAAGNNARKVVVAGLDGSGNEISEEITLAGASASDYTTATFLRVYRAWVSEVGTYGAANAAAIVIQNASNDLLNIAAGEGQSQHCAYTIPAGYKGYMLGVNLGVDETANKEADIRILTRESITNTSSNIQAPRVKAFYDGVTGPFSVKNIGPMVEMNPLTDVWIEAYGDGAETSVSASMEILLVDAVI